MSIIKLVADSIDGWKTKQHVRNRVRKELGSRRDDFICLIGTPTHRNMGDSAIAIAEIEFLKQTGRDVKEITRTEYQSANRYIVNCISNTTPVFLHGGGNMGNQWMDEELFRRSVIKDFSQHRLSVFPQTLHYLQTNDPKLSAEASVPYYNNRDGLTLIAREKESYTIMKSLYPDAAILLMPDIVLSTTMDTFGVRKQERQGVLLCIRNDAEKALTASQVDKIENVIERTNGTYRFTDMYSEIAVTKDNRRECVQKKMKEFTAAELVITDRLHGMVFAAITETPCIALGNYNHKVRSTYEWIKHLPYVRYTESVESIEELIQDLKKVKVCRFDNTPFYMCYDAIMKLIKQYD